MKKICLAAFFLGLAFNSNILLAQTETSGRESVYRATHTITTELKHTKLKVSFDYEKEHMHGEEWLTASPYFYESDSLVLNAKGMLIHEVALDNKGQRKPLQYNYKNDILHINLDKKYQRQQDYTVYIKYTARPNEVKQDGSAAINDAKGLYFINAQGKDPDKPIQIWTQGETESSSAWFPTIDKPNQKTTQEIYMTVPDKYVTLSNGVLKEKKKEANGLRTDHWVMDKKHAPYLFFMGVGDFAVVKDQWRSIPVDYYVEKEYEPYAKEIFGLTPEMMEFYSKKLGYDYPWQKYSQMVARDYVSGAMENTTAVLHAEAAQQKTGDLIDENKWEATIAHELFHHWFGDLVTTESWSNLTVNESFANYSEYLWFEHKYGVDEAAYHLKTDLGRYIHTVEDFRKDLVRFDYDSREDMFDLVSYNKGGGILHMLRNYLGDEAFYAGMNHYLKSNEYGTGEAHQLRLSFEKVSGKDLNWFFNQWYFSNGNPKINYSHSFDPIKKEVTVFINQTQAPVFEFPLAFDIYQNGKPTRQKVWVNAKTKNHYTFSVTKNPEFINLNPDGVLLADISENKSADNYAVQYANTKEFYGRYSAVEKLADLETKNDAAIKGLLAALKDPFFRVREKAIKGLDLKNANVMKIAGAEVERIANTDPKTIAQAAAIKALAETKNPKYLSVFEKGMKSVSNSVKGASLVGIAGIDNARTVALANELDLSNASESIMDSLLPIIVKNKMEKHMPAIASTVAFYPFIKFQDPEQGKIAEEGYNWIMSSDNLKATENVTKIISQVKREIENNPQAKMMMIQILKEGLDKKMQVLKANPTNALVNKQVDAINKVIESYK